MKVRLNVDGISPHSIVYWSSVEDVVGNYPMSADRSRILDRMFVIVAESLLMFVRYSLVQLEPNVVLRFLELIFPGKKERVVFNCKCKDVGTSKE